MIFSSPFSKAAQFISANELIIFEAKNKCCANCMKLAAVSVFFVVSTVKINNDHNIFNSIFIGLHHFFRVYLLTNEYMYLIFLNAAKHVF